MLPPESKRVHLCPSVSNLRGQSLAPIGQSDFDRIINIHFELVNSLYDKRQSSPIFNVNLVGVSAYNIVEVIHVRSYLVFVDTVTDE